MDQTTTPTSAERSDLTEAAAARLDAAYERRERRQASRDDFSAGYLAALLDYQVIGAFAERRP